MKEAFQEAGFEVAFVPATEPNLADSLTFDGYVIYHRNTPKSPNALEVRPTYVGPFWSIDKTAVHKEKRTYLQEFDPESVKGDKPADFYAKWRKKAVEPMLKPYPESDFVLIALQGILLKRRAWQRMTPIKMVEQVISAEPERRILIKLHPGETYSDDEMSALNGLCNDRVELVSGDLDPLLAACAYTVSMNSSVSFLGLFHKKPGILFGDADFHHVFQRIKTTRSIKGCVGRVLKQEVPYEKYIYWFLNDQMINANREWAKDAILSRCAELGWDVAQR